MVPTCNRLPAWRLARSRLRSRWQAQPRAPCGRLPNRYRSRSAPRGASCEELDRTVLRAHFSRTALQEAPSCDPQLKYDFPTSLKWASAPHFPGGCSDEGGDGILVGEDADHLGPPLDLIVEAFDWVSNRYENSRCQRSAAVFFTVAYGATTGTESPGTRVRAGRYTLSREHVLVAGRLCESPGCAEHESVVVVSPAAPTIINGRGGRADTTRDWY